VGNILSRHGIPPTPERKKTTTWTEFIYIHMDVLGATDFFTNTVWNWLGLVLSFLLVIMHVARRTKPIAGAQGRGHASWRLEAAHLTTVFQEAWRREEMDMCGPHEMAVTVATGWHMCPTTSSCSV
jgi:putative transposase